MAHALGLPRSGLYADDRPLSAAAVESLRPLVERRAAREPLAYVLGEWGFRRLTLSVDPRVLVPRPETEVVVARCLALLQEVAEPRVLDVGVGSGAIALAIADEHPGSRVIAVDNSADALAVARENARRSGLEQRVELVQGDVFAGLAGPFHLVVSNPPYVGADEIESLAPEVRDHEPRVALVASHLTKEVARGGRDVLAPGGWLVLECGDGQAQALADLLRSLAYENVTITRDLNGVDRVVEGRRGE